MEVPQLQKSPFHYAVFVDGSTAGLQAFFWALSRFSPEAGDRLTLSTIVVPPVQRSRYTIEEDMADTLTIRLAAAERLISTYKDECSAQDVDPASITWNIISNASGGEDVRDVILNWVNAHDVSLLVLGERGLGTVAKVLLGSVTKFLLRRAPCAVAVVRTPKEKRRSSQDKKRLSLSNVKHKHSQ